MDVPVQLIVDPESHESVLRREETMPIPAMCYATIPMPVRPAASSPAHTRRLNQVHVSCAPECGVRNHTRLFVFDNRCADNLPKQGDQILRRADQAIEWAFS